MPLTALQHKPQKRLQPFEFPPPPKFTDPARREKLSGAFPEIHRLFRDYLEDQHVPGLAFGIVIDGELVHVDAMGLRHIESNAPVTRDSVFRIASMSKSFVAMAVMRLRDEGKLWLDDLVATYIPEFKTLRYPTTDSPEITLRHLLTMVPGFPEDNPWGDRQMALEERAFARLLRAGIPFSNAPNVTYEYSNYGYAVLGRIVTRLSGMTFQKYITKHILKPLGMNATVWDKKHVPPQHLAHGYRYEDDLTTGVPCYRPEPILPDGAFAGMAGLFTTVPDFARYMSFLLDAFPPRNDPDDGPVKRATAREMQQLARYEELVERKTTGDTVWRAVSGYGFGLAIWHDDQLGYGVSHGGGLPGYGSYFYLLPHHGVGIVALTNRTYSRVGFFFTRVLELLAQTGGLQARIVEPAEILVQARAHVQRWLENSDEEWTVPTANNFFLDHDLPHRRHELHKIHKEVGAFVHVSELEAWNALRGKWRIQCERGWIDVMLTLSPTMPPAIQQLQLTAGKPEPQK